VKIIQKERKEVFHQDGDGGPITRSKTSANKNILNKVELHFNYNSAETAEAINLI
jgi:hypothetical protein